MAIYMQVGSIKGSVSEDKHKEWIEVHSLQFGMGRGVATAIGKAEDRVTSAPSISEVSVSKLFDKSSLELIKWFYAADGLDAKINVTRENGTPIVSFELKNTILSAYSISSGGDAPSESLSLNFTSIATRYSGQDAASKGKSPETVTYDLETGKTV